LNLLLELLGGDLFVLGRKEDLQDLHGSSVCTHTLIRSLALDNETGDLLTQSFSVIQRRYGLCAPW